MIATGQIQKRISFENETRFVSKHYLVYVTSGLPQHSEFGCSFLQGRKNTGGGYLQNLRDVSGYCSDVVTAFCSKFSVAGNPSNRMCLVQ